MRSLTCVLVVVLAGCPFGDRPCRDDDQCEPEDFCDLSAGTPGKCRDPDDPLPGVDGGPPGPPPVIVAARTIAVGQAFACGLTVEDTVFCLGSDNSGALARDDTRFNTFHEPEVVIGLENATDVVAALRHVCAIADGPQGRGVYCWGDPVEGRLGVSTPIEGDPLFVKAQLPDAVHTSAVELGAVSAGVCVRTELSAVHCFGPDIDGYQPGFPVENTDLQGASALRFSLPDNMCIITGGDVNCVDELPQAGCGLGTDCPLSLNFDADGQNVCHIVDNTVSCGGSNEYGVTDPSSPGTDENVFQNVADASANFGAVAVGSQSACAIGLANEVVCWGRNLEGSTGQGANDGSPCSVNAVCHDVLSVDQTEDARFLSGRRGQFCAIDVDGVITCWGEWFSQQALAPTRFEVIGRAPR